MSILDRAIQHLKEDAERKFGFHVYGMVRHVALALSMVAATILLLNLLQSPSQTGDVLFHCPPQTDIGIEISPKGDTAAIHTGIGELSFFSTATWSLKKCRIRSSSFFAYISEDVVSLIGQDGHAYMVDPRTGESHFSFPVPGDAVGSPTVCGGWLCVPIGKLGDFYEPSTVLVMDFKGHVLKKFLTVAMSVSPAKRALCSSPDGRWLVALGLNRAIIYRAGTWQKVADIRGGFERGYQGEFVTLCSFSLNGKRVYLGSDALQRTYETGTWKRKEVSRDRGQHPVAVMPTPDGMRFFALLGDGSLRDSLDTWNVVVPSTLDGSAGRCIEGVMDKHGLLLTGWENGDIRKQVVPTNSL